MIKKKRKKNLNGKELKKQIGAIEARYNKIKTENPIFVLEEKMKGLKKAIGKAREIENIKKAIDSTTNRKAQKIIGSFLSHSQTKVSKIYSSAIDSPEMQKVSCPRVSSEDILYVEKDGDGFNITRGKVSKKDAYNELFKKAFSNVRFNRERTNTMEQTEMSYVENEMQELNDVEEYWGAKDFKNYIERMEKDDPQKAQEYKREQIKKRETVRQLKELYSKVNENREGLDNINKALKELKNSKSVLTERVYNKCKKSLEAQRKKEQKKEKKLETQKSKLFNKTNLIQSINNAKKYKEIVSELKKIPEPADLENLLENLNEAKRQLAEEKAKSEFIPGNDTAVVKDGEVYEEGNGLSGYYTNGVAVYEAEQVVRKCEKEFKEASIANKQNEEARENYNHGLYGIHANEVSSTIKGAKANPQALGQGEQPVKPSFMEKYSINHEAALENVRAKEHNQERVAGKEEEETVQE